MSEIKYLHILYYKYEYFFINKKNMKKGIVTFIFSFYITITSALWCQCLSDKWYAQQRYDVMDACCSRFGFKTTKGFYGAGYCDIGPNFSVQGWINCCKATGAHDGNCS